MKNCMNIHIATSLLVAIMTLSGSAVAANPAFLPEDPKRPVDKIGHDLDIAPEQFTACFRNVSPAPQGTRPTADRVHSNKAILLSCLQKANANITNDMLDEVMDRYRPGEREAQLLMNE
ncbi:MAG: hypothetical protein Q7U66_01460 [Methylobacter sp.]|nr:hypothetical protein [Methylobacter sp.]